MKHLPEIAPELRGLLEEIVSDPRSALRLTPRRALRSWFENAEPARVRDVSTTRAERHLIEVHREALAEVLLEAAIIAYWKKPSSSSLRRFREDGQPLELDEPEWRNKARRFAPDSDQTVGVTLLRGSLGEIAPHQGRALAAASLSLAPSDAARLCLAFHSTEDSPRWALSISLQVAGRASSAAVRGLAAMKAGAQCASLGRLDEAKHHYEEARGARPNAWFSLFNLACVMGRTADALECSSELGRLAPPESPIVNEVLALLRGWHRTLPASQAQIARSIVGSLADELSATARKVGLAYA